jgi:hypothetical protein
LDLDVAADELYVVPPADFVARRNELAAEAIASGDKATAAAIKKLRKPTLSAWLANLLVHERKDETDQLLHLGEVLRSAQRSLAGAELRQLARKRHEVIGKLVSEARGIAQRAGQPITDEAARELASTLSAALADESDAEKLRLGRLTSTLEHVGFGPLELLSADAEPVSTQDQQPTRKVSPKQPARQRTDEGLRQRRAAAERALRDAKAAAPEMARQLGKQEDEITRLQGMHDERRGEVANLEVQLTHAKAAEVATGLDLRNAQPALHGARQKLRLANDRITQAENELTRVVDR